MYHMFVLILAIVTLVTGLLWCWERFQSTSIHYLKRQISKKYRESSGKITNNAIIKVSNTPNWLKTCSSLFPVLLLVFIVRSFIFEPFQIPSGSMMPTLLDGDFILVEKFAYGIKNPITQTTIIKTGHPKRGDVVVFKYPPDPKLNYIKRVVGLPGDRITYDYINKHVTIQSACSSGQECNSTVQVTYSEFMPSNFVQTFHLIGNSIDNSSFLQVPSNQQVNNGIRLVQCKESLGGVVHNVLITPGQEDRLILYYQQQGRSLAEWVIPQGEYFMIGDNRDNSADSRYWGFVPERNLVGKATAIWISFGKEKGQWPINLRLNRIGGIS